jgi:hypothetical protein
VTGDGTHVVSVRAVDATGNVGEARPLTVGIDTTAPVSQAAYDPTDRTVDLSAADAGAGVDRIEYRLDGGAWQTYAAPVELGAAAATLQHRGVDALGNVEQAATLQVPAADAPLATTTTSAVAATDHLALGGRLDVAVRVTGPALPDGAMPTGGLTLREGPTVLATATLSSGRATLTVPATALGLGRHRLTVAYAGDASHAASQDDVDVTVAKASSHTTVRAPRAVGSAHRARVTVLVNGPVSGALPVTGRITLTVRKGRTVVLRHATLAAGRARVTLPRLRPGRYRLTATYAGSADVAGSTASTTLRITKAGR